MTPATRASQNLKRKLATNEEAEAADQPRKLPAIAQSGAQRPTRSQTRINNELSSSRSGPKIPTLTVPRPPTLSSSTRANSAPPKSLSRLGSSANNSRPTADKRMPGRSVSGTAALATIHGSDNKRFQNLENQLGSIEDARSLAAAKLAAELDAERDKAAELYSNLKANQTALSRDLEAAKAQERNHRRELVHASDEIENIKKKHSREIMDLELGLKKRDRQIRELNEDVRLCRSDLESERESVAALKSTISQLTTTKLTVTTQKTALQAQINTLTSTVTELRLALETEEKKVERLEKEARDAESLRRKLHNMVQELKGNIRVFCRVRPVLPSDLVGSHLKSSSGADNNKNDSKPLSKEELEKLKAESCAEMSFPDWRDHKEIALCSYGESAMGKERKEVHSFGFDRVFGPEASQIDVFEEISQLAQSCIDGYNICIFAYGQTGSGKSFTMEGGPTEAATGMIPRAVQQVFRVAEELKDKGWAYEMEGQFLEIYNETINDLLGKGEFDKKKYEIKHCNKTGTTRVTDANVIPLRSPEQVRTLLALAQSRRTVAATLMNERSSRSHSVFTLRIVGNNQSTGEQCAGSLNLVDLAGSERLNASGAGADRERLKETQNINKSLSALGDVISALGEKAEKGEKHIPYRNSKLTYLLQNSLSGNSKTLMVLNLSPLAAHLNESLTSLRFATKVNNTMIGTAKKQSRTS